MAGEWGHWWRVPTFKSTELMHVGAQLAFSFLFILGLHTQEWGHQEWMDIPISVKRNVITLHRHSQRSTTQVILDCVELSIITDCYMSTNHLHVEIGIFKGTRKSPTWNLASMKSMGQENIKVMIVLHKSPLCTCTEFSSYIHLLLDAHAAPFS